MKVNFVVRNVFVIQQTVDLPNGLSDAEIQEHYDDWYTSQNGRIGKFYEDEQDWDVEDYEDDEPEEPTE